MALPFGWMFAWVSHAMGLRQRVSSEYVARMRDALEKVRTAELQIAQAGTLEELDLGRSALQQARAEVQHIIRAAKREQGLPLRTISDCEDLHRQLQERLFGRRRRGGTRTVG